MSAGSNLPKLAVGDRLLMVTTTDRFRTPKMEPKLEWHTVTKVGRQFGEAHPEGAEVSKWNARRFDLKTGHAESRDGRTAVRLYQDEEHFRASERADSAWVKFRRSADLRDRPLGVSEADILNAAELLKLELGE